MADVEMRIAHLVVRGRVQGVGFRQWTVCEAQARGLRGWVRNRLDGSVEALVSGSSRQVDAMITACRHGPSHAAVTGVDVADPDEATLATLRDAVDFRTRATA